MYKDKIKYLPASLLAVLLLAGSFYLASNQAQLNLVQEESQLASAANSLGMFLKARNQDSSFDGPTEVSGELVVEIADNFDEGTSKTNYYVHDKVRDKIFAIQGRIPEGLKTGDRVKIKGNVKNQVLDVEAANNIEGETSNFTVESEAELSPIGSRSTLVILGRFSDKGIGCSVDQIDNLMFSDPNGGSVNDLYVQTSEGDISFSGDVYGTYTIDYTSDGTSYYSWAAALDAAVMADGVDPSQYDNVVYVLPFNGTGYGGVAQIGGRLAWIFQCQYHTHYVHEIGHNLGFHHANTPTKSYGDTSDPMGVGNTNHAVYFNSAHKIQGGWVPAGSIVDVNAAGTYTIAPLDQDSSLSSLPQILRIKKADTDEYYYVSYRRPYGFSSILSTLYKDRINIHRQRGTGYTYFLSSLSNGTSYLDSVNGIDIKQIAVDGNQAIVSVSVYCDSSTPSVGVSPISTSGSAGSSKDFQVNIRNNDGANCSDSPFTLSVTDKSGWSYSWSQDVVSIPAGSEQTVTLNLTSPEALPEGLYSFTVNADGGLNHSASSALGYYIDNTNPTVPQNLNISEVGKGKKKSITLSWSESSDNVRVVGYNVFLNGSLLDTVTTNYYSDRNLPSGTYNVQSIDEAGNVSNLSVDLVYGDGGTTDGDTSDGGETDTGDTGKPEKCSPWPECNKN